MHHRRKFLDQLKKVDVSPVFKKGNHNNKKPTIEL